jgi:hypothetical protein
MTMMHFCHFDPTELNKKILPLSEVRGGTTLNADDELFEEVDNVGDDDEAITNDDVGGNGGGVGLVVDAIVA